MSVSRLHGIDVPETAQRCTEDGHLYPCGLDASQALRKQIGRKPVSCVRRDTDRYGRMVALCIVNGVDISRWMAVPGALLGQVAPCVGQWPTRQRLRDFPAAGGAHGNCDTPAARCATLSLRLKFPDAQTVRREVADLTAPSRMRRPSPAISLESIRIRPRVSAFCRRFPRERSAHPARR